MSEILVNSGTSVIQKRIVLLKRQHDVLDQLLGDPHPGLLSWLSMVPEVIGEMQAILDGERDE